MKMKPKTILSVAVSLVAAAGLAMSFSASAQSVPPSYTASPDMYKLLSENDQFRVVRQTIKPGKRDAWHSHAGNLVAYRLTDCKSRTHTPDGKYTDADRKRGDVAFLPAVASHSFENIGKTTCETLIVERQVIVFCVEFAPEAH
jgi:beta-alanine degradation protein BauB